MYCVTLSRRRKTCKEKKGVSQLGWVVVAVMKNNQNATLCLTESQTAPSRGQLGSRVGVVRVISLKGRVPSASSQ